MDEWEGKNKSIKNAHTHTEFWFQEWPSHSVTKGTYSSGWTRTWGSALTQAGCRRKGAKCTATRWSTPLWKLSPFRVHYSDELLLNPEWSTGYLFGKTTVSLFCRNNHCLHHHGSRIPSGRHVPDALWERLCDSQPTAAEGKSPPAPPPTHKEEKERRWLNFIFSDQIIILSEIILRFQIIHTLYTLNEDLLLGIKHCLLRAFQRVTENIRKTVY